MHPDQFALVHFYASLVACILIFVLVQFATPTRRKPVKIGATGYAIAAFLFATHHSADRDPWQWPSMFVFVSAILMVVTSFAAAHFAGLEENDRNRLIRKSRSAKTPPKQSK